MTDLRPRTRNSVLGLLAALVLCLGIGFDTAGIPQADSPDQGGTSASIGGDHAKGTGMMASTDRSRAPAAR